MWVIPFDGGCGGAADLGTPLFDVAQRLKKLLRLGVSGWGRFDGNPLVVERPLGPGRQISLP
ncbi:MAG: hypothetical protein IH881_17410 [Myxococcales bacterium]|nr:hypothetical protein [Myxococcales bacterium]